MMTDVASERRDSVVIGLEWPVKGWLFKSIEVGRVDRNILKSTEPTLGRLVVRVDHSRPPLAQVDRHRSTWSTTGYSGHGSIMNADHLAEQYIGQHYSAATDETAMLLQSPSAALVAPSNPWRYITHYYTLLSYRVVW